MAFALARTRALLGLEAPHVSVEVHLSGGLPQTSLVGLPAAAVRESKDRVRAALVASDFRYPDGRVIINLGPAELPKEGGRFDLPIALGILAASGQLPPERLAEVEVVGELSLNGTVQPVRGAISCAVAARESARGLILPAGNAREAAFARAVNLFPVSTSRRRGATSWGRPRSSRSPLRRRNRDPGSVRIWRTCGARRWPSALSRLRRRAVTTSSWSVLPAPGRRCSPRASPASFRQCASPRRSRPWPSTPPGAWSAIPPRGGKGPSGRRTTRPRRWGSRAEAVRSRNRLYQTRIIFDKLVVTPDSGPAIPCHQPRPRLAPGSPSSPVSFLADGSCAGTVLWSPILETTISLWSRSSFVAWRATGRWVALVAFASR